MSAMKELAAQIEEVETLLSYYEHHGAQNGWTEDVVTLLRDALPEWSAFTAADAVSA